MKTIIAGGRNIFLLDTEYSKLDDLASEITEVVSGGANGVDSCGEKWAKINNIPVKIFAADWNSFGKKAGYLRNKQMAMYSDAAILFKGGKGTDLMYNLAKQYSLKIYDYRNSRI